MEPRRRLGTHAHQLAHGQGREELGLAADGNDHQAIGLLQIGCDLGDGLAGAQAHGDGEAGLGGDALLDVDGNGDGRAVGGGLGDVQVSLVKGHGLDHRGDVAEDVHDLAGHLAVAVEPRPHDDTVGALAHGGCHGHGRMDAELPRLVGRRGHHAATLGPPAHQHGQPAQLGVIQLLHGRVKGVQVGVDDVAGGWHGSANRQRMWARGRRSFVRMRGLDMAPGIFRRRSG